MGLRCLFRRRINYSLFSAGLFSVAGCLPKAAVRQLLSLTNANQKDNFRGISHTKALARVKDVWQQAEVKSQVK
jgi:hypothetical protein